MRCTFGRHQRLMPTLLEDAPWLLKARGEDLHALALLLLQAAQTGRLPDLADVPWPTLATGACALTLLALALVPGGRRLLSDALDTLLATALLVALVAALLCLPLATVYVSYRGLLFLAASIAESHPALAKLLPSLPALLHAT